MDAELGCHNMPLDAEWASRTSVSAATASGAPGRLSKRRAFKFFLTAGEEIRLLRIGTRRTLMPARSINGYAHMLNTNLITRFAQGLLAVAATGASMLILQFAMVA